MSQRLPSPSQDVAVAKPPKASRDRARLPPFIVEPTSLHTHTIIFLHGLGNSGQKWGTDLLETGLTTAGATLPSLFPGLKFVFPSARKQRSKRFKRAYVAQWFELHSIIDPSQHAEMMIPGLEESGSYIRELLQDEIKTVSRPGNVFLAGISQGCAMALTVLISLDVPIGGFVGLCGFLPFRKEMNDVLEAETYGQDGEEDVFGRDEEDGKVDPVVDAVNVLRDVVSLDLIPQRGVGSKAGTGLATPVYLGHGEMDERVPYSFGRQASETLQALEMDVVWKTSPELGHWFDGSQIDEIAKIIRARL